MFFSFGKTLNVNYLDWHYSPYSSNGRSYQSTTAYPFHEVLNTFEFWLSDDFNEFIADQAIEEPWISAKGKAEDIQSNATFTKEEINNNYYWFHTFAAVICFTPLI